MFTEKIHNRFKKTMYFAQNPKRMVYGKKNYQQNNIALCYFRLKRGKSCCVKGKSQESTRDDYLKCIKEEKPYKRKTVRTRDSLINKFYEI